MNKSVSTNYVSVKLHNIELFLDMTLKTLKKRMKYSYFNTYYYYIFFSSLAGQIKKFNVVCPCLG